MAKLLSLLLLIAALAVLFTVLRNRENGKTRRTENCVRDADEDADF